MKAPDGGPAFPLRASGHVEKPEGSASKNLHFELAGGMSLRDYFAGQALAGGADSFCDAMGPHETATSDDEIAEHAARHARAAYRLADAMLKERQKEVKEC